MILTCPECASRYFVDDAKVGPEGRNVRCAKCGARWHATMPAAKAPDPAPPPAPEPPPPPPPEPAAALPDDLAFVETEAAEPAPSETAVEGVGAPPPKPATSKSKGAVIAPGLIWGGLALVIAAMVAALIVFRAEVVRAVPNTASAYAAVGLTVNPVGLVIEDIRARPSLQDGRAALTVTGVLRNIERREVMAPPLRVSLLNTAGKTVAGKIAAADDPLIPAGESRHFSIDLLDPPSTSKDLEVAFVLDGVKATPVKVAAPAPTEAGHGEPAGEAHPPDAPASDAGHAAPAAEEHH